MRFATTVKPAWAPPLGAKADSRLRSGVSRADRQDKLTTELFGATAVLAMFLALAFFL